MSEHSPRRVGEWVKENKAEAVVLALGAAALAWEMIAPDKENDLISHAADRHPIITAIGTVVLGTHLCNIWEKLGLEQLDTIAHIGKRFGVISKSSIELPGH